MCVWSPYKAEAVEGLQIESYLSAAEKLYSVAKKDRGPLEHEFAIQLLYAHDFDILTAIKSMATAIGADKLVCPDAPVSAATSIVRGRAGVKVGLHLSLRGLAASVSQGQGAQGFVRSTRSRSTSVDFVFPQVR